jgi:hypothetical protein
MNSDGKKEEKAAEVVVTKKTFNLVTCCSLLLQLHLLRAG